MYETGICLFLDNYCDYQRSGKLPIEVDMDTVTIHCVPMNEEADEQAPPLPPKAQ